MELRPYQAEAVDAVRLSLARIRRPLVCLPTGSGKTPVLATIIDKWRKRLIPGEIIVSTVHTQELVGQSAATYERISGDKPCVFSASLKRKELGQVVFAQIQSIYKLGLKLGRIKAVIVDECDRIPFEGEGVYRQFLADATAGNSDLFTIGLTATPFRTKGGPIYGKGRPFQELVYSANVGDLIDQGYLCPIRGKECDAPNMNGVKLVGGDYNAVDLERLMADESRVRAAWKEVLRYRECRRSVIHFTSGMKHALLWQKIAAENGVTAPIIEGTMDHGDRARYINAFKEGAIRDLININVLSIGFDAPMADLGILARPTKSPGLYYQQIGRFLRISPGKCNAMILDFAGNIERHGPIDTLNERMMEEKKSNRKGQAPVKVCANCKEIVPISAKQCPACRFLFPEVAIAKHAEEAAIANPVSKAKETPVTGMKWRVHIPRDKTTPPMLRVDYFCGKSISEFFNVASTCKQYAKKRTVIDFNGWAKSSEAEFNVVNDMIVVTTKDGTFPLPDATVALQFISCFRTPSVVQTRPESAKDSGPAYHRVVGRRFD